MEKGRRGDEFGGAGGRRELIDSALCLCLVASERTSRVQKARVQFGIHGYNPITIWCLGGRGSLASAKERGNRKKKKSKTPLQPDASIELARFIFNLCQISITAASYREGRKFAAVRSKITGVQGGHCRGGGLGGSG